LLDEVFPSGNDGKTITKDWLMVQLIFQAPATKKLKYLHLTLPAAAFHADGAMIRYEIDPSEISAKSPQTDKADKSTKGGDGDAAEGEPKSKKD
jgi:hypothetical protein